MPSKRNQSCPCRSGLKQKKCHGDIVKIQIAKQAYKNKMQELIDKDIKKKYDNVSKGEKT